MKFAVFLLFYMLNLHAAGSGEGSPIDLIPGFVNLAILLSILGYLLRKPLATYFTKKSDEIRGTLERASAKAKEAEMMMSAQKKKVEGVRSEVEQIKNEAKKRIAHFQSSCKQEIDQRIEKMKEDAAQKIESEKKEEIEKLNSNFLDEVILSAKSQIRSDKEMQKNATSNILRGQI